MSYDRFIGAVMSLGFLKDRDTTVEAVRAVIADLVTAAEDAEARRMTRNLPHELTPGALRESTARITRWQLDRGIAERFKLTLEQAHELIDTVAKVAGEITGFPYEELDALCY